jgi:hypothetical protein
VKAVTKILGLAVGQRSFLIAEVTHKGGRHAVTHVGEFVFPEGTALSAPERLGQALRQFLKSKQFTAKEVVIGLPAKRLVTRRKDLPAASLAVAASTLRLQAESEFSSELDNLIMDFAGTPSSSEPTTVLIMATKKVEIDELEATAQAAGLKVRGITSTTAALGRATSRLPGGDGLVVNLGPGGAEMVIQHGLDPAHLRHLNVLGGKDSVQSLAGEIRRTMAGIPKNGTPQTLALWMNKQAENPRSALEQRLSMPVSTPELGNLVATDAPDAEAYVSAVAVALSAMDASGMPVDFLHSRMAPPKEPAISMQKKLAIAGGVLLAVFAAYAWIDIGKLQTEKETISAANQKRAGEVALAKAESDRMDHVNALLPRRAQFIPVMRDMTQMFSELFPGSNTIWVTSLSHTTERDTWSVAGRMSQESYGATMRSSIINNARYNARFSDVTVDYNKDQQNNVWIFKMSFSYKDVATAKPGTQPVGRNGAANTRQPTRTQTGQRTPTATTPAATAAAVKVPATTPAENAATQPGK